MRNFIVSLTGIALMLLSAGPASAVLIDFDTPAAFTVVDNFYAGSGVTFEGVENGVVQSLTNSNVNSGAAGVPSAPNYLWNSDHPGGGFSAIYEQRPFRHPENPVLGRCFQCVSICEQPWHRPSYSECLRRV